jgi:hypothetical protein
MIVPFKKYTIAEVERLRVQYPDLKLPGMVTRANMDGTVQFVPWQDASGGGRLNRQGQQDAPDRMFSSSLDDPFGELPLRERRDPRVQLASLMDKVRPDFMAGRVLTRDEVATYVSKARAKELRNGAALSDADFTDVMKAFIKRAEDENEALEAKKVVRTAPSE